MRRGYSVGRGARGVLEENRSTLQKIADALMEYETIDTAVVSHAHIDHSGNLPNLVKQGFRGKIVCTPATADLCGAMLLDSGHIQEEDVEYVNRQRQKYGEPPVEPIYTQADAAEALKYFQAIEYEQPYPLWPGVTCTLYDAGHMLGSAIVGIDFQSVSGEPARRLVFTGDLGRTQVPLLCDPARLTAADILLLESTYGNRTHPPIEESAEALKETIRRTSRVSFPLGFGGAITGYVLSVYGYVPNVAQGASALDGIRFTMSIFPAITFAASFASGNPMALLTNGTVRDARGLTSST